ncbi:MAG: Bug family tripartite tricarboxylate transporter substrate binding protein [Pigmentiphaga sp.]
MKVLKSALRACVVALGMTAAAVAHADYPDKAVSVVVGFPPGGTNDIVARVISAELEKRLGQPFVVENKPGAASMLSANQVKRADPDGYTLLVIASGGLVVNPAIYAPERVTYDSVEDFEPIALLARFPFVLVTGPKLKGIDTLQGFIDYAKKSPTPLAHGSASSTMELMANLFADHADIKFTNIPYKGSGPTATDLMGGQTDFAFLDTAAVIPAIQAGRLQALGVTTIERSAALPDVPTIDEGGIQGYDAPIWTSLVAPADTPQAVVDRLNGALAEILKDPSVVERFAQLGMATGSADDKALVALINSDLERWKKVADDAGIRVE